jgi:ankyrin repeat protein
MKKVAYLVRAGANVNVQANYGHTPLYLAAMNGHLLVVKYLVHHGADIHLSRQGKTPMRIAIDTGEVAVADYLYQVSLRANSTQYEPVLRLPKLRI